MGASSTKSSRVTRICLIGLDASGKMELMKRLVHPAATLDQAITTQPALGGLPVTHMKRLRGVCADDNIDITSFCPCPERRIRRICNEHIIGQCDALIWVLDSNDRERLIPPGADDQRTALELFTASLAFIPIHVPIMFLANKMDLPSALSTKQICNQMELITLMGGQRRWSIHGMSMYPAPGSATDSILSWIHTIVTATVSGDIKDIAHTLPFPAMPVIEPELYAQHHHGGAALFASAAAVVATPESKLTANERLRLLQGSGTSDTSAKLEEVKRICEETERIANETIAMLQVSRPLPMPRPLTAAAASLPAAPPAVASASSTTTTIASPAVPP